MVNLTLPQRILMLGRLEDAAWSPLALPNLLLWLDATAIRGLSDGDPLAVWSDASTHHNDATQPTFAQRPAYRLVGGKPVARFDGADDGLALSASIAPPQLYVAMAIRATATASDMVLLSTFEGAEGGFAFGTRGGTLKCFTGAPPSDPSYPGSLATDTFALVEALHDGMVKTLLINGAPLASTACTLTHGINPAYVTSLGYLDYLGGGYQRFGGDIGEVIVCGAIPGVSALSSLRSYVAAKWGITMNAGENTGGLGGGD